MGEPLEKKLWYSKEEYLKMESTAEYKSEYYQGEIFAMSGGTMKHSVICVNLNRAIWEAIRDKNCTAFESNMKLDVVRMDVYVYPDMMVVCGPVELSEYTPDAITNPVLIIEVLSSSTESFDRGKKFEYYRTVASLKEYVLVSQDRPRIESYFKQNENIWQYTVVEGMDKMMVFQSLNYEVPVKEIYYKTDTLS